MKEVNKQKIKATAVLLFIGMLFVITGEYIAGTYERDGEDVPKWVYYIFMIFGVTALGIAYSYYIDAFSKKSNAIGKSDEGL